jgi:hypothetical protein
LQKTSFVSSADCPLLAGPYPCDFHPHHRHNWLIDDDLGNALDDAGVAAEQHIDDYEENGDVVENTARRRRDTLKDYITSITSLLNLLRNKYKS